MLLNILKIMVNEIKKIIIQFFPPILVNFLRKLRRKENKLHFGYSKVRERWIKAAEKKKIGK